MKGLPLVALAVSLLAVPASAAVRHEHHFSLAFSQKAVRAPSGVTFTTDRFIVIDTVAVRPLLAALSRDRAAPRRRPRLHTPHPIHH
jgi:hypothetical protein